MSSASLSGEGEGECDVCEEVRFFDLGLVCFFRFLVVVTGGANGGGEGGSAEDGGGKGEVAGRRWVGHVGQKVVRFLECSR